MPNSRRILILPLAGLVIAGLVAYKLSQAGGQANPAESVVITRRAPFFELYDQRNLTQLIRLKAYIGRHRIILVFFDPQSGLANDPVLVWLRRHAKLLRGQDVKVIAISNALPQIHRKMLKEFLDEEEPRPFQMLSDLDGKVHRLYGRFDDRDSKLSPGVFLIDRAGNLAWNQKHPLRLDDPLTFLNREFGIE